MYRFAVAFLFALAAGLANAQQTWEEGKHYFLLDPPQPTLASAGKIEVTEVFSFGCPACNLFQPTLRDLVKALPPSAEMHYVHASFIPAENWPLFQRAFLSAQLLGIDEKSHDAMYEAVWGSAATMKAQSVTLDALAKFYSSYGVDAKKFTDTANSFGINSKMKQSDEYVRRHMVSSTPTLIVAGKYRFSPADAGGAKQTIDLVLYLLRKEGGI